MLESERVLPRAVPQIVHLGVRGQFSYVHTLHVHLQAWTDGATDDELFPIDPNVLLMSLFISLAASGELGELRFGVLRPLPPLLLPEPTLMGLHSAMLTLMLTGCMMQEVG